MLFTHATFCKKVLIYHFSHIYQIISPISQSLHLANLDESDCNDGVLAVARPSLHLANLDESDTFINLPM